MSDERECLLLPIVKVSKAAYEARQVYKKMYFERNEALGELSKLRGELVRLVDMLISIGATEDAREDPVGAAIDILQAYAETGPWPGKPVPVKEPEHCVVADCENEVVRTEGTVPWVRVNFCQEHWEAWQRQAKREES